jgi:hypothetical protein
MFKQQTSAKNVMISQFKPLNGITLGHIEGIRMVTYFLDYNTVMQPVKSDKNKQLIRITVKQLTLYLINLLLVIIEMYV